MARERSRLTGAAKTHGAIAGPLGRDIVLPVAAVLASATFVFAIYGSTLASMIAVWARSQTFAHGFLILPIALWLLLRQRSRLAATVPAVSWWGSFVLGACVLVWAGATIVQADVLRQAAMMGMIPAVTLLILGPAVLGTVAFPLAFSLLAVPAGEFLIGPMMDLTANGSVLLLQASGVPVFQDGWLISIPGGNFQVADACSGVRYLIGAATTGVLFAYLFFRSMKKRILFMAFVIILTVLANVVRAYIIVLLAHLTDMRLAVGVDHFIYGWFLFSLLLLAVFAVGLHYADPAVAAGLPAAATARFTSGLRKGARGHAVAGLIAALVLLSGPLVVPRLPGTAGHVLTIALPMRVGTAELTGDVPPPRWLRPGTGWDGRHARYLGGPAPFEVHVFVGGSGPDGRDLTWLREKLAGETVTLVSDEEVTVPTAGGPLSTREVRLEDHGRSLRLAYWYEVGHGRTANPITAKLMEVRTMIAGEHKRPAMVTVAIDTNGLAQPGASLHVIAAEVAASISACSESGPAENRQCESVPAAAD